MGPPSEDSEMEGDPNSTGSSSNSDPEFRGPENVTESRKMSENVGKELQDSSKFDLQKRSKNDFRETPKNGNDVQTSTSIQNVESRDPKVSTFVCQVIFVLLFVLLFMLLFVFYLLLFCYLFNFKGLSSNML